MKKILALLLSLLVTPALAQTAPTPDPVSIYMASVPLAVTTASARVVLPSASVSAASLTVSNDGANDVCIAKGSVTVVATNGCLSGASSSTSFLIPAGRTITIFKNSAETYLAAIGAGATTLHVYQSNGPVWIQGSTGGTTASITAKLDSIISALANGVGTPGSSFPAQAVGQLGRAATTDPTAVTDGQGVAAQMTKTGRTVIAPFCIPENCVQGTTAAMTGTTSTLLLAAPGGSLHNYVTELDCVNSHATVGTFISVQDGSGGTTIRTLAAGALFGGQVVNISPPLRQPTAGLGLYVADVTTGANVICNPVGFLGL